MEEHTPKRHVFKEDWAMFSNFASHPRFNTINVIGGTYVIIQQEGETPLMSFKNLEENDCMHDLGLLIMSH